MMRTRLLSGLLAAVIGGSSLFGLSGCLLRVRPSATVAYEVDSEPPPPRRVYVQPRAGYVWMEGYWYWNGGQWQWIDGHWERERGGHVWVQGVWVVHGGRYHWKPGHWKRGHAHGHVRGNGHVIVRDNDRGGPKVRDHRKGNDNRKEKKKDKHDDDGPKVRDHRKR